MRRRREVIRDGLQQRVASGLHLGRLHPGDRLGSARKTAREVGSDYRLVVGALRGLQQDGLVEIRARGGLYAGGAAPPAAGPPAAFGDRLAGYLHGELGGGLAVGALAERLRHCLDTARLRAACVECNVDQLDFLCQELQAHFGLQSRPVEVDRLRRAVPLEVRQADLLVTTVFHAGEVRHCAARLGKPCVVATLDPRRRDEVIQALAEGPVCFVGTDPRWAAKARLIWGREPGAERLHTLTLGHDPMDRLPPEAQLMLMPRARRLLGDSPLARRALPRRGLSLDTRREILSFVVRANLAGATPRGPA
jgi:hypothetical protein